MDARYDIVIFGATGFTGKLTLEAVQKLCCVGKKPLKVAIAGRSREKLLETVAATVIRTGIKADVPILIADASDEKSLTRMAKKAKVVINCCGPYLLYGEPVVKACIAEGTHHIDVTGEALFIQRLYLNYSELAQEKGVYVVNTCGHGCIPADMGAVFLESNFKGTLNSIELYHELAFEDPSVTGAIISTGAWASFVNFLDKAFVSMKLQEKIKEQQSIPECKPKLKVRMLPHKPPVVEKPSILLPSWDKNAIEMTQAYLYHTEKKRPVQANVYFVLQTYFAAILMMLGSLIWIIFSKTRFTRELLIKYPGLFTRGFVRSEDPSEKVSDNLQFCFTLFGEGWKDKFSDGTGDIKAPINQRIVCQVRGKNPYVLTGTMAALCAKVLLTETKKLPKSGGVYSPGAAFGKTSLIKQLNENGLHFELISTPTTVL